MSLILARCIIRAIKLRENSYDYAASLEEERQRAAQPNNLCSHSRANHYKLDMHQAATQACVKNPELTGPVYLLISHAWNDAAEWAERTYGLAPAPLPGRAEWLRALEAIGN